LDCSLSEYFLKSLFSIFNLQCNNSNGNQQISIRELTPFDSSWQRKDNFHNVIFLIEMMCLCDKIMLESLSKLDSPGKTKPFDKK